MNKIREEIERQLRQYGFVDVEGARKRVRVKRSDVMEVLEEMQKEGKIVMEGKR